MLGKLRRLPAATRAVLKRLACLGSSAPIATLTLVQGGTEDALQAALEAAVRARLLLRQEGAYQFLHDRVREAAYALIPEGERAAAHLAIGRRLAARTLPRAVEESVFEIVGQLNRGAALIGSGKERERLAELNLIAGRRAKSSTAYASALTYLAAGASLLPADAWKRRHDLAFALELNRAECEFLTGALAEAEARLAELADRAASHPELATPHPAAGRPVHDTRAKRSRRCGRPRVSAPLRHRLVGASDEGRGEGRVRPPLAAARRSLD